MNSNRNAKKIAEKLNLQKHPEGGYFREIYRSESEIPGKCLTEKYGDTRSTSTAIYYMLEKEDFSCFHRIISDEIFHFYSGAPVNIYQIDKKGNISHIKLGSNIAKGEQPAVVVYGGNWQALIPDNNGEYSYSLMGTTVAPGFDFADFEIGKRDQLLKIYPQHAEIINSLTRS
jgi:hypothetical protein